MKCLCPKSAIFYEVPEFGNFGNRFTLHVEHPIFSLTTDQLLSQIKRWADGNTNAKENRLLFLALLNNLEDEYGKIITFRTAAIPANGLIQQYMQRMFMFVGWYTDIHTPSMPMPHYVVDTYNCNLSNIKLWLESWEEKREEWQTKAIVGANLRAEKAKRAEEVIKVIKHVTKTRSDWRKLAIWAMDAALVPESYRKEWISIICTDINSFNIYQLSGRTLAKILYHMESYLDIYNDNLMAHAILTRIRELKERNALGFSFAVGMQSGISPDALVNAAKTPFTIVEPTKLETINRAILAQNAPTTMPIRSNYATLTEFIKAKAKYQLRIAAIARDEEAKQQQMQARQEEILHENMNKEDAALLDNEEAQLQLQLGNGHTISTEVE